jgi:MYXO-CTERM domain-containing protein
MTTGLCITTACVGVTCSAGQYCKAGSCVADCSGAVCPAGQTCTSGKCVEAPDAGVDSGEGLTAPDGGFTSPGADGGGSNPSPEGGAGGATFGSGGSRGGCGCRSVGNDSTDNPVALALAAVLAAATRRGVRRRKR